MRFIRNAVLGIALGLVTYTSVQYLPVTSMSVQDDPQVMPDKYCSKTYATKDEKGNDVPSYYIFFGPDDEMGMSTESCTAAAWDWYNTSLVDPVWYST